MAFDSSPDTFTLEADMDPRGAVLLAGAAFALEHDEREWWSTFAIPCERTFTAVEDLGEADEDEPCESGEVVCWLLLLMREAVCT